MRTTPKKRPQFDRILSIWELKKLRSAVNKEFPVSSPTDRELHLRDHLILEMAIGSGLRMKEMVDAKIEDIENIRGRFQIKIQNGNQSRNVSLELSMKLYRLINQYVAERSCASVYVLSLLNGNQMSVESLIRTFRIIRIKAALNRPFTFKDLKATYALHLYVASGFNVELVQMHMGHLRLHSTREFLKHVGYGHFIDLDMLDIDDWV